MFIFFKTSGQLEIFKGKLLDFKNKNYFKLNYRAIGFQVLLVLGVLLQIQLGAQGLYVTQCMCNVMYIVI